MLCRSQRSRVHGAKALSQAWKILEGILSAASRPLTRRDILTRWPVTAAKPNAATLWRWLERFMGQELVIQEGQGRRNDPFRFRLAEPGRWAA
jgi:hypothetical protein